MSMIAYDAFVRDLRGKYQEFMTAVDLEQAIRIAGEMLTGYEINQIIAEPQTGNDVLLEAFLDAKLVEGRTEKTVTRYEYVIKKMLEHFNLFSINITTYHIRKYMADEKERSIKASTLRGVRDVFSSYFGWLTREGLIQKNPMGNISAVKTPKVKRKAFTDVELEKLKMKCYTKKQKALICFLDASGCRVGEIVALNRSDIDLDQMRCTVHGKGNKDREIYFDEVSAEALREYLEERTDDCPALFLNCHGNRLKAGGIRDMLKKIAWAAQVKNVHPHRFRRTRATKMIKRGMPIQEVAIFLGHDKIETTMLYLELDQRNVENSYRRYA